MIMSVDVEYGLNDEFDSNIQYQSKIKISDGLPSQKFICRRNISPPITWLG